VEKSIGVMLILDEFSTKEKISNGVLVSG